MAAYRKLWQPLWSWSWKYQRRAFCLNVQNINSGLQDSRQEVIIERGRKAVSLKEIISAHSDLYDKIIKEDLTNEDWRNIRENILQNSLVTATMIDSTIIDLCLSQCFVDKAIKYVEFLKEYNYPLSVAIIGRYLRLFVLKHNTLTDADKQEIVATCDALMEKYSCLDSITAEHCITSLCLTDQWEKSIKIIDMIKLTTVPGTTVYSALASAAFLHKKPNIGWDAMQQIISRRLLPNDIVYPSYLQYCEYDSQDLFDNKLEEMFAFWGENDQKPYNRVLSMYAEVADKHGWSSTPTDISQRGKCKICLNQLSDLSFDKDTFQDLANAFLKRVVIGSDIFYKSHPRELEKFMKFINGTKPYDIVIDALNVTYMGKGAPKPQLLADVVKYFVERGQKVLVLTRKHQKKLPVLKYIQQHATVFWTDNLSSDDPYLLYATLASGEKAMFVSSDLMRQHKYLLKDEHLQWVFKKWQCSHQYFVKSKGSYFQIISPFSFIPHAQKNSDSWHIPYISNDSTNPETHEFPDMWYCFHKKRSNNGANSVKRK